MNTFCLMFLFALCINVTQSTKLLKLISVVRNGARTPRETFNKEQWGETGPDTLTSLGAQQMFLLGKWTQQFYIHDSNVYEQSLEASAGSCSKERIHVLFSCEERTIQSGLNFLRGLCRNYEEIYPYVVEKYLINQITNTTEKDALRRSTGIQNIDSSLLSCTLSEEQEFYFSTKSNRCPRILLERSQIWQSPKFQSQLAQLKALPEYGILLAIVNRVHSRPSEENEDIYDLVALSRALSEHNSYLFHGKTSPYRFTAHQITLLYRIAGIIHFELLNGGTMQTDIQGSLILQNLKDLAVDLSPKKTRLLQSVTVPANPTQVINEIKVLEKVEGDLVEKLKEDIKEMKNKTNEDTHKTTGNHTNLKQNNQSHANQSVHSNQSNINSSKGSISKNSSSSNTSHKNDGIVSNKSKQEIVEEIVNKKKSHEEPNSNQTSKNDSYKTDQNSSTNQTKNTTALPQIEVVLPPLNQTAALYLNTTQQNKKLNPTKLPKDGITLISAKESTLITLLKLFQVSSEILPMDNLPNFSSQINIEYWQDDQNQLEIVIKYNQKKIRTFQECKLLLNSQCVDFISFLDSHIVPDLKETCQSKL